MAYPDLTDHQIEMIDKFQPPKFYKLFYKAWDKVLKYIMWFGLLGCVILGFADENSFEVVFRIFLFLCGIAGIALIAYLWKHFYTVKYANKIGLSIKAWNYWTIGKTF